MSKKKKPKGYDASRRLRRRARQHGHRGGNTRRDENTAAAADGNLSASRDAWLADLASLNYRPSTIEGRRADLRHFLEWAHQRSLERPEDVTRSILESYRRHISRLRKANGKPLGATTQRHRLGAVKSLFAWLCKQDLLPANPASEVELPRPEKALPEEALSERQIAAVLAQPDATDPLGVRDRALLELLYASGIRRSEAARLEVADLNCERRTLRLRHTKSRRERVVPIGGRALRWLLRYLDQVRPRLEIDARHQALFLTGYGEAFNPDVLGRKVAAYVKRADTGRPGGGCHLLRHSCANHLLEGGADIRFIQQLLGHAKLETTAIYTEVNIRQLREVHRRCHPAGGDEEGNAEGENKGNDGDGPA